MAKEAPKSNGTLIGLKDKTTRLIQELEEAQEFDEAKVKGALSLITEVYKKILGILGGTTKKRKELIQWLNKLISEGYLAIDIAFLPGFINVLKQIKELIAELVAYYNKAIQTKENNKLQQEIKAAWQQYLDKLELIQIQLEKAIASFEEWFEKYLTIGEELREAGSQLQKVLDRLGYVKQEEITVVNNLVIEFSGHFQECGFRIPQTEFANLVRECAGDETHPVKSEQDFINNLAGKIEEAEPKLSAKEKEGLNPVEIDGLKGKRLKEIKAQLNKIAKEIGSLKKLCDLYKEEKQLKEESETLQKRIRELEQKRKGLGEEFKKTLQEIQKIRPDKKQEKAADCEREQPAPTTRLKNF